MVFAPSWYAILFFLSLGQCMLLYSSVYSPTLCCITSFQQRLMHSLTLHGDLSTFILAQAEKHGTHTLMVCSAPTAQQSVSSTNA